jgi:hypothetical protein
MGGSGRDGTVTIRRKVIRGRGRLVIRAGDVVEAVAKLAGIKPCPGCVKRGEALNRLEIRL